MMETTNIQKVQKRIKDSIRPLVFFEAKKVMLEEQHICTTQISWESWRTLIIWWADKKSLEEHFQQSLLNHWMQR